MWFSIWESTSPAASVIQVETIVMSGIQPLQAEQVMDFIHYYD